MKHKQMYAKWITRCFLLLMIMYACSSDYENYEESNRQFVEPLTVQSAQDYYSSAYGNVPKLKSYDENQISLIPDWDIARLHTDSLWYAVESPVGFDDVRVRLVSSDVSGRIQSGDIGQVKQVLRLVILRNKETGKTVSFIMAVLPDYNYMKLKGDVLHENQYLTRTSDLDGAVLFFGIDGEFINGWIYENGSITGGTLTRNSSLGNTKKMTTYCWTQVTENSDGIEVARTFYCEETGSGGGVDMSDRGNSLNNILNNGGIDDGYSDPIPGGSGGSDQGSNEKKPGKRTDCTSQAAANANNAENALKMNTSVSTTMGILRNYAATKSVEYSALIDSYGITDMKEGVYGQVPGVKINSNTLFDVHTHHNPGTGKNIYKGPSIADIQKTLYQNNAVNAANYRGSIIFGYDGTEYLVYIEDKQKAKNFVNGRFSKYMDTNSIGWFEMDDAQKLFDEFYFNLLSEGYSDSDAYIYGMSHYLNVFFDTGIKLYIKESGMKSQFKELKTEKVPVSGTTGYNVKPSICP